MRTARRSVILLALVATATTGCESTRSFFQMSSDSPMPFLGFDMTLPPKFGRGQDAQIGEGTFGESRLPRDEVGVSTPTSE